MAKKFGDTWAKKYLQEHRNTLKEQFETEKRRIELEFEKSKTKYLRYSGKQFELYNSLWQELIEVKICANTLWNEASPDNLQKLAQAVKEAKAKVEKSKLFLEEDHYQNLIELLESFSNFRFGKRKLIQIRSEDVVSGSENEIRNSLNERFHVLKNEAIKENYENMLNEISDSFKSQIKRVSNLTSALS